MSNQYQYNTTTNSNFAMEEIFSDNYMQSHKLLSQNQKKLQSQIRFKQKDNNEKQG